MPITRSQDNTLRQTKLTASLNGSITITGSSPSMDSVSSPVSIKLPGTPGRAHRCSQKTLFPASSQSVVETVVSELVNSVVAMESENENGDSPQMDATPVIPEEERDLQEMLLDTMEPTPSPPPNDPLLDFYKKRVIDLQQQVIDIGSNSEKVTANAIAHAAALESTVKLLNEEIEGKNKEIKRLQTDLDRSRLDLSKANGGLRHHMNSKDSNTSAKKSTDPTSNASFMKTIEAEFAANRAEMAALKKQLASVLSDDSTEENGPFQTVVNRRRNRRTRQPAQPTLRQPPQPAYSPQPPTYADVTARPAPKPTTLSFGSSLARGTQNALRNNHVDALEYSFPGADIPRLRREIIPILQENPQVDTVLITGGGNDCEREGVTLPQIKAEYDALVDAIKIQQGWECKVVINSVPQRRRITTETRHKIAGLNLEHYYHSDPDNFVYFCDSAPKSGGFFRDRVHLNHHGLDHWARKVTGLISNFQPVTQLTRM